MPSAINMMYVWCPLPTYGFGFLHGHGGWFGAWCMVHSVVCTIVHLPMHHHDDVDMTYDIGRVLIYCRGIPIIANWVCTACEVESNRFSAWAYSSHKMTQMVIN